MPRPIKCRRVCELPKTMEVAPVPCSEGGCVELSVDEYEAVRLLDIMGLNQEECAVQMNIARTTVQSIYAGARRKLAEMLVNGRRLIIAGGCFELCPEAEECDMLKNPAGQSFFCAQRDHSERSKERQEIGHENCSNL